MEQFSPPLSPRSPSSLPSRLTTLCGLFAALLVGVVGRQVEEGHVSESGQVWTCEGGVCADVHRASAHAIPPSEAGDPRYVHPNLSAPMAQQDSAVFDEPVVGSTLGLA